MKQFRLPDVGEGLTEAEVVSWKVKVGDTVKVNEIIVEIETAKSLVELPSPYEPPPGAPRQHHVDSQAVQRSRTDPLNYGIRLPNVRRLGMNFPNVRRLGRRAPNVRRLGMRLPNVRRAAPVFVSDAAAGWG